MSIEHSYLTSVADRETGVTAEVGTLALSALADKDLAGFLRAGQAGSFLDALSDLEREDGALPLTVATVDMPPSDLTGNLRVLLASALASRDLDGAMTRWASREEPDDLLGSFIDNMLGATVLAEYSDAAALQAAGAIGAAAAGAQGAVVVALVQAGQIGGIAVLIAGPAGIVIVGVGAAYVAWRLFTHRRRK